MNKGTYQKGHVSWLKGTKGLFKHSNESKKKISMNNARNIKGKKHSLNAIEKIKRARKNQIIFNGEKSHLWKGDDVGYGGLHAWVRRELGTPKHCANCQTSTSKKYEWANLSHSYKRELSDWIRLCTKCHINYDHGKIKLFDGETNKKICQ